MLIENQKELIQNTLVNDAKNVKESLEVKEGLKVPMDIFNNFYFRYGFYYTNKDRDVLKNYQWKNNAEDTNYAFDDTIQKYVVEYGKPAILQIPNFYKNQLFARIYVELLSKDWLDEYKVSINVVSGGEILDNFEPINRDLIIKDYGADDNTSDPNENQVTGKRIFFESKFFSDAIDPNDLWLKIESNYQYLKFGIMAYGVEEIAPTNYLG